MKDDADRLQVLEAEAKALRTKVEADQVKCNHPWNDHDKAPVIYDPITVTEGYGSKLVGKGSDVWSEYEGYRDVEKPRWKRTCPLCGKVEYTYDTGTQNVDTGPDFSPEFVRKQ